MAFDNKQLFITAKNKEYLILCSTDMLLPSKHSKMVTVRRSSFALFACCQLSVSFDCVLRLLSPYTQILQRILLSCLGCLFTRNFGKFDFRTLEHFPLWQSLIGQSLEVISSGSQSLNKTLIDFLFARKLLPGFGSLILTCNKLKI